MVDSYIDLTDLLKHILKQANRYHFKITCERLFTRSVKTTNIHNAHLSCIVKFSYNYLYISINVF